MKIKQFDIRECVQRDCVCFTRDGTECRFIGLDMGAPVFRVGEFHSARFDKRNLDGLLNEGRQCGLDIVLREKSTDRYGLYLDSFGSIKLNY